MDTTKYYNVWRTDNGTDRWVMELYTATPSHRSPDNPPSKLSYIDARKSVEYWRQRFPDKEVWVREIADDGVSPGEFVGYNLWVEPPTSSIARWTNGVFPDLGVQDITAPFIVSYQKAVKVKDLVGAGEIREIGSDMKPQAVWRMPPNPQVLTQAPTPVPVSVPEPTTPPIDFDRYNGVHGLPSYMVSLRPNSKTLTDPYTGLPIKLKGKAT